MADTQLLHIRLPITLMDGGESGGRVSVNNVTTSKFESLIHSKGPVGPEKDTPRTSKFVMLDTDRTPKDSYRTAAAPEKNLIASEASVRTPSLWRRA